MNNHSHDPRDRLVTLKKFATTFEANLALATLKNAGIDASLAGELTNEVLPLNVADREVDLLVPESQLELAQSALADIEKLDSNEDVGESDGADESE
ncbi:MAG TPA: DUF2007 domain-containing protein [Tepidisphaeraceae bacterium]|nr:DUF2007 domain-containing protein [Tepidisphaeraceae bacterium]